MNQRWYNRDRSKFLKLIGQSRRLKLGDRTGVAVCVKNMSDIKVEMGRIFDRHLHKTCGSCRRPCCRYPGGWIGYYQRWEILTMSPLGLSVLEMNLPSKAPEDVKSDWYGQSIFDVACPFLKDHGCMLHRSIRSYTCTAYTCVPLREKFSRTEEHLIMDLKEGLWRCESEVFDSGVLGNEERY